jgi:hypothetical protein
MNLRIDGFSGIGAFLILLVLLFVAYKMGARGGGSNMGM